MSSNAMIGVQPAHLGTSPLRIPPSVLPSNWISPEGVVPVVGAEVEVIQSKRLLEHSRIGSQRNGHEGRAIMVHVVAANDTRTVGQSLRMTVVSRVQQQSGRVDGTARDDHDVGRVLLVCSVVLNQNLAHLLRPECAFPDAPRRRS